MTEDSTAALVKQAQGGSAPAFEVLVRRHLRAAYSVALAVLSVPSEAEDVAQDALVVAWERLHECREAERFSGWLVTLTRNLALNVLAKRSVRSAFAQARTREQAPLTSAFDTTDARKRLTRALEQLSVTQREVVLLHDLEGWTHAEIAAALNLTEVNARQHLFNARRILRGLLDDAHETKEVAHGP